MAISKHLQEHGITVSGVAKLGHTGARALATRGCAPLVQALLKIIANIGAECTVIWIANWALKVHMQWRIQGGGNTGHIPPPRAVKRSSLGPRAGCSYVH